jgi:hypothetical protein
MGAAKKASVKSAYRAYAICVAMCCICLALAGLAYLQSVVIQSSAAAQGDRSLSSRLIARLSSVSASKPIKPLVKSAASKSAAMGQQAVVPTIISRVASGPGSGDVADAGHAVDTDLDDDAKSTVWVPDRSDTFRTVCVRLCDGAFYPVSFATTRDRFKADAERCQAGCSSPSRLFIAKPDASAEALVDLSGRGYADLPNAFKFRTTYDAACSCRGQPWETAELERHRKLGLSDEVRSVAVAPTIVIADVRRDAEDLALKTGLNEQAVLAPSRFEVGKRGPVTFTDDKPVTAALTVKPSDMPLAVATPSRSRTKAARDAKAKKSTIAVAKTSRVTVSTFGAAGLSADGKSDSMQRSFRSKEYWRLSYWEPKF